MPDTYHFVVADFGQLGHAFVERELADADRASTVRDIVSTDIAKPVTVFAGAVGGPFRDVTADIAQQIADDAARHDAALHPTVIEFVSNHCGAAVADKLKSTADE